MNTVLPEWVRPVTPSSTGEPKTASFLLANYFEACDNRLPNCLDDRTKSALFAHLNVYLSVQTSL